MLKKFCKVFVLGLIVAGTFLGCDNVAEGQWGNLNPSQLNDPMAWDVRFIDGKENTVTLELEKDVDFFAWTKENGEYCEFSQKGKSYIESFKLKKGKFTFTFAKPGRYILNLHTVGSDVDFKGNIVVGKQAVNITEKGYACTFPRQAIFTVTNDSKAFGPGNNITKLIYVEYEKSETWNQCIFKKKYEYNNLYLKPGTSINMLFPAKFSNSTEDVKKGGHVLKPVVDENGELVYIGNTTCRDDMYSQQGAKYGNRNGDFYYIGDNRFRVKFP